MKRLKKSSLPVIGFIALLLCAVFLLYHGNANSVQAMSALTADVYFDGEYRIGEGPWNPITEGQHIPSTEVDVTLRGNFHMLAPDGEYVGIYSGDIPIAFYTDHINLSLSEGENEPFVVDTENPIFGDTVCCATWTAVPLTLGYEGPVEIVIHNPHSFGNELAIDALLSNVTLWTGIDFERGILSGGEVQRNTGVLFVILSFVLLGTALFSALIHIKKSGVLCLFGLTSLFAGIYFIFSADGISFWQESIVTNTTLLGCSMMLYMVFLSVLVLRYLNKTKKIGTVAVVALSLADALFFLLPTVSDVFFYDTWPYWVLVQASANSLLIFCLVAECFSAKGNNRWLYFGMLLPLIAFCADALCTHLGLWKGGFLSTNVFCILLIATFFVVLRIIPRNINAAAKAKELETERNALNAQLAESRISTMISQIRPHFIYNTLGSIEYLCLEDPAKAGKLVHSFAKYLRGNFGELDNPKPIRMSQEMEHVRHYVSIENVRFPDMTFTIEMNSNDFMLPALTIQPIVENAIKHGLMKLTQGGSIRVLSWETPTHHCVSVEDNGVGFDTSILMDERKHIGLRNIRGRLESMVGGTMEIESTIGKGTKVCIKIPK